MRSRPLLVIDGIAAALFAVSAAIQHNDPDPAPWIAIYLAGALAAALGWRWIPGLVIAIAASAVALGWAVYVAVGLSEWVGFERVAGPMEIEGGSVELTREALGLLIIAGYSAFVALRWRKLPSRR